jgi:hypothetical protein
MIIRREQDRVALVAGAVVCIAIIAAVVLAVFAVGGPR